MKLTMIFWKHASVAVVKEALSSRLPIYGDPT